MKLINKLDETANMTSLYSGQSQRSNEWYLRPVPKYDENGKELKKSERYYVVRLLYFTGEDRNTPFIVRKEHTFFKKDFEGNVKEIKRICCPTTSWARKKIQEPVDKDYCPICKYSYEQNIAGWKNFRNLGQIDTACLDMSKETERVDAIYIPVLVISDPIYRNNNNHFRVLRLAGEEGMSTYKRICEIISEANRKGVCVFNGEEGANIAFLCEKVEKVSKKRNGEVNIDKNTGEPKTYKVNSVTDIRLLDKKLHSYNNVTEENLEKLMFDEIYGAVATKEQLSMFLNENYLDNGAADVDMDDEFGPDESEPVTKNVVTTAKKTTAVAESEDDDLAAQEDDADEFDDVGETEATEAAESEESQYDVGETEDEDDEFENESPRDAIARITKGKVSTAASNKVAAAVMGDVVKKSPVKKSKIAMKKQVDISMDTEDIRDRSLDIDPDDLPF